MKILTEKLQIFQLTKDQHPLSHHPNDHHRYHRRSRFHPDENTLHGNFLLFNIYQALCALIIHNKHFFILKSALLVFELPTSLISNISFLIIILSCIERIRNDIFSLIFIITIISMLSFPL